MAVTKVLKHSEMEKVVKKNKNILVKGIKVIFRTPKQILPHTAYIVESLCSISQKYALSNIDAVVINILL